MNKIKETLLPYFLLSGIEAGLDEVGRGCLAGPVVASAVILPKDFVHADLTDSKQLTSKQRTNLVAIVKHYAIEYAIAEVDNEIIDQINIYKASVLAMHKSIDQLKTRPDHLLIDGNRFINYHLIPHTCMIKGDSKYFSIAAASILAKTYRDAWMKNAATKYPGYGWERNAGYPTLEHRKAVIKLGLTEIHRKTFRVELKKCYI